MAMTSRIRVEMKACKLAMHVYILKRAQQSVH